MKVAGQIVSGRKASITIREKSGVKLELGDLLVAEDRGRKLILQVFDLTYGSQISDQNRELFAGMKLEGYGTSLDFLEPELRNYVIADAKPIALVGEGAVIIPKTLPPFFSSVRYATEKDLGFLVKPENPVFLGQVRSGSKVLDVDVYMNGREMFSHHVLIPATTGRGKSNLVKVMLWSVVGLEDISILVLDPHDEYYGRHDSGLKDHPQARENVLYYSPRPLTGTNTLVVNLRSIKPWHFNGIVYFSDAQQDAIKLYHARYKDEWIEGIMVSTEPMERVSPRTLEVLQRRFDTILGVYVKEGELLCRNRVFSSVSGETTIKDIIEALEEGKIVVIDTSRLLDDAELLIGSIVTNSVFRRYQEYKSQGKLLEKPVISLVLEEAPRVIGSDILSTKGENIYSTVAREGRKFQIGLIGITQLTSLIPRTVLANMNTKIILGNEMAAERTAVINSAAQDLTQDDRNIASLDKGEAIISSNFTKFAVPIQIPLFKAFVEEQLKNTETKGQRKNDTAFTGVDLE